MVRNLMEITGCEEMDAIDSLSYCYENPMAHPLAYLDAINQGIPEERFDKYVENKSSAYWMLEVKLG